MQGGIDDNSNDFTSFFKRAYENRKAPAEFFGSFVFPTGVDSAYKRANENISKFSFYYLLIAGFFYGLFVVTRRLILIPILIVIGCYFLSKMNLKLGGYELTPTIVMYGCIGINVIMAIVFPTIAFCYFFLIGVSAICAVIILAHACLLESSRNGNEV